MLHFVNFIKFVLYYLNFIVGGSSVDHDYRGEVGLGYLLPMLIETKLLVDHKGKYDFRDFVKFLPPNKRKNYAFINSNEGLVPIFENKARFMFVLFLQIFPRSLCIFQ